MQATLRKMAKRKKGKCNLAKANFSLDFFRSYLASKEWETELMRNGKLTMLGSKRYVHSARTKSNC